MFPMTGSLQHGDMRAFEHGMVAGPGLGSAGAVRAWGVNVECVQVRLSPVIARAILGASPADLDGAVVSLGDLWGREASRMCEQIGEVASWQDRFLLTDALLARRPRSGGAVNGCGPVSGRSSACRPSAP
ncbi:hypothetical protein GA0115234_100643 [Streptomyces sp. DvalAA-43]|jgi:hypothetical protein|nr:hypothetical protein GA0115234_100643 [Streptomyces sp. DvalAA-43]